METDEVEAFFAVVLLVMLVLAALFGPPGSVSELLNLAGR